MRFGDLIAQARKAKRITLRDLGLMLGVSPGYISEIEHGKRLPPAKDDLLRKFSKKLGLELNELEESARLERSTRSPGFLEKALGTNRELAMNLYRAGENATEDAWKKAIEKAIKVLQEEDE